MNKRAKAILQSMYPGQNIDLIMIDLSNSAEHDPIDKYGEFTKEALSILLKGTLSESHGRNLMIQGRVIEVAEEKLAGVMSEDAVLWDQVLYRLSEPTICVLQATGSAVSKERIERLVNITWVELF